MSEVSVIIPTYNRAEYVTQAIDSVLAQTYEDYEIIVVDDGSIDNTKEVLEPYTDNITYIYQENAGVSAARNTGIRVAKGEWIAFLDSDDEWLPEKLAVQIRAVERHPQLVAHTVNVDFSNYEDHDQTSFLHCGFTLKDEEGIIKAPLLLHFKHRTIVMPQAVICRKVAAVQAGLFDESLSICEDYDFMCRIALQGSWGYSTKVLAILYRRPEGIKNLSAERYSDAIKRCSSLIKTHLKLLENNTLTEHERRFTAKLLSSNFRELGQHLLLKEDYKGARESFKLAFHSYLSVKSILWSMVSKLPVSFSKRLVEYRMK
ncbi:MAG: glycosyltransferase family 2 protein [Phycisphaerae bacterium]